MPLWKTYPSTIGLLLAFDELGLAWSQLQWLVAGVSVGLGFGFFVTSQTEGFAANPGGSAGNFCLGGAVGRYVGPGQILNSGSLSQIELTIDLTQVP
ncbi:MAG: hypothetical protein AAGG01_11675, partial [Planctomycetota bacterium]